MISLTDAATFVLVMSGFGLLLVASGVALDVYDWFINRNAEQRLRELVDMRREAEAEGFDDWWSMAEARWDDEGEAFDGPGAA